MPSEVSRTIVDEAPVGSDSSTLKKPDATGTDCDRTDQGTNKQTMNDGAIAKNILERKEGLNPEIPNVIYICLLFRR